MFLQIQVIKSILYFYTFDIKVNKINDNNLKKRKLKSSIEVNNNYKIIGISTTLPAFKFCWLCNQQLKTSFKRMDDYIVHHKIGSFSYPLYQSIDEDGFLYIIENKPKQVPMNSQFKIFDYFLIHQEYGLSFTQIIEKIDQFPKVVLVKEIEFDEITEKENFMIDQA